MQRLMICKKGKRCIGTLKNKEKTNGNNFEKRVKGKEREAREFRIKQNEFLNIKKTFIFF